MSNDPFDDDDLDGNEDTASADEFEDGLDEFDTPVAVSNVYPTLAQIATLKYGKGGRPVYGRLCLFRPTAIERVPKMDGKPGEMTDRATVDVVLLDGENITEKILREGDPVPLDEEVIVGETIIEGMWINATLLTNFFRKNIGKDGRGNGRWILGRIYKLKPTKSGNSGAWDLGNRNTETPAFSPEDADLARKWLRANRDRL